MASSEAIWKLDALLSDLVEQTVPALAITGVCQDSRLVQSGDLYLATAGAVTHGMRFAEAAVAAGAPAVACSAQAMDEFADVVEALRQLSVPVIAVNDLDSCKSRIAARFHDHADRDLTLIAVTGTDGKTSVCRFLAQAFSSAGRPCGYIGTLGWGLGESLQATELTTPDAVSLHRMLALMKAEGAELVALEASSHGLAEGRLDGLHLDVAVLTNLGRDHLDYHGTPEAYKAAKARLFSWPELSAIVVNGRDSLGRELLENRDAVSRMAFISDADCAEALPQLQAVRQAGASTVCASLVQADDNGLQFVLEDSSEAKNGESISTALLGRFNVDNLLACYAGLRVCGMAANEARHALTQVRPVDGRMERFGQPGQPTVVVDFCHTPQALAVAIDAVRVHCRGSLWVVFGCGGDRDPGKRAPMAAAAEAADRVVLTDDNPRTESSQAIIDDAMAGFRQPEAVVVIADRARAIAHAISQAGVNDLVLVAGKGHEDYQIIGTTRHPFSDRGQVLAALELAS